MEVMKERLIYAIYAKWIPIVGELFINHEDSGKVLGNGLFTVQNHVFRRKTLSKKYNQLVISF